MAATQPGSSFEPPRGVADGRAKGAAKAAVTRMTTGGKAAVPELSPAPPAAVPPSVRAAQVRRAARAREASVAGWLRRLSSPA